MTYLSLLPSGMHMHSQVQPGAAVCETTAGRMDMLMPPSESAQLGRCHDVAPLSFGVVCGKVCVDSLWEVQEWQCDMIQKYHHWTHLLSTITTMWPSCLSMLWVPRKYTSPNYYIWQLWWTSMNVDEGMVQVQIAIHGKWWCRIWLLYIEKQAYVNS